METWKEFDANELTHSAAHHLLAIYGVGATYGGWARVSDIARRLDITRGSVSITLRALKRRGLVETDEHHMVKLSDTGQKAAQAVMAKRLIVKTFLSEVLGTPEPQADIDSCKIEHLISDETGERLARFTRLLTSGDPVAQAVLALFHSSHGDCPDDGNCEVCKGRCLAAELGRAI
ncbi:MAG: metal-dependent transcriptional regulator [Acidobacteria bacterium]|nr:metal-dependent transcriptional regulator [Acidobacteriota bacterium]